MTMVNRESKHFVAIFKKLLKYNMRAGNVNTSQNAVVYK